MAHIQYTDANAYIANTKLALTSGTFDANLEAASSTRILGALGLKFDTSTWVDQTSTPALVKVLISMYYVADYYDRQYSDDEQTSNWAARLRNMAQATINALLAGTTVLVEEPNVGDSNDPLFFPNDDSSMNCPTSDFPSDGGPAFLMGQVF